MDLHKISEIKKEVNSSLRGFDMLEVTYLDPGPGYCGSFEINVAGDEDMDSVCDALKSLCKNWDLDIDDWHSGDIGFIIPLYAYWDNLDD